MDRELQSAHLLVDAYRATGRLAFIRPRKRTVSLNGGRNLPLNEAIKAMRETIERSKRICAACNQRICRGCQYPNT